MDSSISIITEEVWQTVRRLAPLYVGSRGVCGFARYLFGPIKIMLANGATYIDVTIGDGFEIRSDASVHIDRAEGGMVEPFQTYSRYKHGDDHEATILNALSQELSVIVSTGSAIEEWSFAQGTLTGQSRTEETNAAPGITLRFKPDSAIFDVLELSPVVINNYFRRLSYLHEGVRFNLRVGDAKQEFISHAGIADQFTAISSPYPIMHEPIDITASEGDLHLRIVMAYQSWKENFLLCYMNNVRTVSGGTHERGLVEALRRVKKKLDLPERFGNGVVAIASMRHPDVKWEVEKLAEVTKPRLRALVARLVTREVVHYMEEHPALLAQIRQLETFRFPEAMSEAE